jgi:hypothetical protein
VKRALASAIVVLVIPLAALAADKSITLPPDHAYGTLKPGPSVEIARIYCGVCHSTDYIVMQPHGDAKQWQAVVTKMIKVNGAPMSDQDAKTIVEYLASEYGPAK